MPEARLLLVGDEQTRSGFKAQIDRAPDIHVGLEGTWRDAISMSEGGRVAKEAINMVVVANAVGGLNALIALVANNRNLWRVGLSGKVFDRPGILDVDVLGIEQEGDALTHVARGLVSLSKYRPPEGFWGIRFREISQPSNPADRHSTPIFANGLYQQVLDKRSGRVDVPALL